MCDLDWFWFDPKKVCISGPGSLTCDLVFRPGQPITCPPGCHGTGGCQPQERKFVDADEFYKPKREEIL